MCTATGARGLNVTHQASISGRYELPFGNGRRWSLSNSAVAGRLFGGWNLSGIATLLSGFPITPQIGANRSGDGDI